MKHMELPTPVSFILTKINEKGFNAFVVGGCVRSFLMGEIPHDYDICTSAKPCDILSIFESFNCIETGIEYGTIIVMIDNEGFEITTYRIDGEYCDSRHPSSVEFTENLATDLSRRDFTMNAIAYNPQYGYFDPFGGEKDIKAKKIKTVGEPDKRFSEDYLRIFRALRFASTLGFGIDEDTSIAIHKNADGLLGVSYERLHKELNKSVMGANFERVANKYWDVFEVIIPELQEIRNLEQKHPTHYCSVDKHSLQAVSFAPSVLSVKLSLFLHDIGKGRCMTEDTKHIQHFLDHANVGAIMTESILKRLKYSSQTIEEVCILIKYHATIIDGTKGIKRALNKWGESTLRNLIEVQIADKKAHRTEVPKIKNELVRLEELKTLIDKIVAENQCFSVKNLAITGKDLLEEGFKQGPQIGQILNFALEAVIEETVPNKKKALCDLVFSQF